MYCSSPNDLTIIGSSSVPFYFVCFPKVSKFPSPFPCCLEWYRMCGLELPFRLASNGRISKISTPCIFPKISNRSRPVDCSRSVGMVPGWAPGGRRSCSSLISVFPPSHQPIFPLPTPLSPSLSLSSSLHHFPHLQTSSADHWAAQHEGHVRFLQFLSATCARARFGRSAFFGKKPHLREIRTLAGGEGK